MPAGAMGCRPGGPLTLSPSGYTAESPEDSVKAVDVCGKAAGSLQIQILHATGLRNADWAPGTGLSDPYCICEINGKTGAKFRTRVVPDCLNPEWNEEGELSEY